MQFKNVERDYLEFLALFNKHNVKYLLVGAFAVGFHAIPRYTKDMDIWVEASPENAAKILAAIRDFGFGSLNLSLEDFSQPKRIVQLGYEPVRIDIITSIKGCVFEKAWKNRKKGKYGDEAVFFIGLSDLIKNKRATNRGQDIADLEKILKITEKIKKR